MQAATLQKSSTLLNFPNMRRYERFLIPPASHITCTDLQPQPHRTHLLYNKAFFFFFPYTKDHISTKSLCIFDSQIKITLILAAANKRILKVYLDSF